MRDFSRNLIGTSAILAAGLVVMMPLAAASAASAPTAGVEVRNDSAATLDQAAIADPAEIDANIVACASTPPMPAHASAQGGPGATSLGQAGARGAD